MFITEYSFFYAFLLTQYRSLVFPCIYDSDACQHLTDDDAAVALMKPIASVLQSAKEEFLCTRAADEGSSHESYPDDAYPWLLRHQDASP